ncbi:MAG: hypothetical protein CMQ49_06890 [Gammaproteobacteria bacterium]|nr:hypothetical protein [Gammaproteobacteria bacterium]
MSYLGVWAIVVVAGLLSAGALYGLLRPLVSGFVRALLIVLYLVVILLPAPVPEFAGSYAPAFVVLIFEGLFQADGNPGVALRILAAGVVLSNALLGLAFLILRRRARTQVRRLE